ncbi:hypothetical protein HK104_001940 [Borealophlyctis nickersoniae]|nr:hypothetical protein HK104_001940 [Borealophlyctis nickersoniae]
MGSASSDPQGNPRQKSHICYLRMFLFLALCDLVNLVNQDTWPPQACIAMGDWNVPAEFFRRAACWLGNRKQMSLKEQIRWLEDLLLFFKRHPFFNSDEYLDPRLKRLATRQASELCNIYLDELAEKLQMRCGEKNQKPGTETLKFWGYGSRYFKKLFKKRDDHKKRNDDKMHDVLPDERLKWALEGKLEYLVGN